MRNGTLRYQSTRDRQDALRQRLRELAAVRVRFGYRRLTVLLKREGWRVNAKRIYRLYSDEGLTVRTKPRRKLASRARVLAGRINDSGKSDPHVLSERGHYGTFVRARLRARQLLCDCWRVVMRHSWRIDYRIP